MFLSIITVLVDIDDNVDRIIATSCTVMHALIHHTTDNETFVPGQEFSSEDKNEAKGAPYEVKITLDWEVNTRSMVVTLPLHKFLA